ncbi:hypothetical protein PGT21_034696 [Puccinia graminis f. sp. tritici]|uniref:Protein kinase domain-containing protein n=1 Tax=Puccinia graminis f. sp. tritici TaxID=56615 RepID=A0A5B0MAE7_PUCGR|nr:hypothetical protein PGTUg99_019385 [Puccinia graminis f. sp. tritici]KAA1084716.1 hypothetical protein PGT21_034696 [Puccinia graminis f. sp. tritici]
MTPTMGIGKMIANKLASLHQLDRSFPFIAHLCGPEQFLQVLLEYHANRIIFWDLKTKNILLASDGHLKLNKFGLMTILT